MNDWPEGNNPRYDAYPLLALTQMAKAARARSAKKAKIIREEMVKFVLQHAKKHGQAVMQTLTAFPDHSTRRIIVRYRK